MLFPLANNSVLAISAYWFNFADFTGHRFICYITVACALAGTVIALRGFKAHDLGPRPLLYALVAHCLTIIVVFAGIYRGYGLMFGGFCDEKLYTKLENLCVSSSNDWISPLYFSVVTWTTLGYGDFIPPHELRLVAAIEALFGYLFFGIVVGIATAIISQRAASNGGPAQQP
ncbi:potassium channel family protein [Bradyrhizobium sp. BEA-2-5]|uniref:potassium channel family protein n=1 Tax=Bradyrhizobium sp. BEA-2-5 TaxID=3080015 RepID=UPI00293F157D|nr:potassium channel family protein [Bradyrhizobium sp. BEA-2-5]WOH80353.1 potassium channel family protein [Bradyrhizobium sp. BEA-2-5]